LQPRKIEDFNARLEDALARLGEVADLSDTDLQEVRAEIRHLEERLHFWREVTSTFFKRFSAFLYIFKPISFIVQISYDTVRVGTGYIAVHEVANARADLNTSDVDHIKNFIPL
jgi:hypothetical protein